MGDGFDAIVVGAGFGGATCAALLAKRGLRTLLVDKNAVPGGKAMTVGERGFRYDLWPIVGGPSLNSRFAEVLDELEMADQVEILTPERSNVLMYRGASGEYASFVGSASPNPDGAVGALQLLGVSGEDLPEVMRCFGDIGQATPEQLRELDDVTMSEFLSRYRLPQSVVSYLGMQSNIIFVVPIDLLAASEMIRTIQDFGAGGAGRYHRGGFGRMAEVFCQAVERYGGRVVLGSRVERIAAAPIDELIITNSLPLPEDAENLDKITVLSVGPILAGAVSAIFADASVSDIFQGENI